MKKSALIWVTVSFLLSSVSYGKEGLKDVVISIIDSTQSQSEQAKSIYNWITANINYDIKAYLSLSPKNYTPGQTLKSKKGLCIEYANLMAAMCQAAGIEAYTIYGYSKGYNYYQDKVFLHSDHCWNVIRADSTWIIADPTWGCGRIQSKPYLYSKVYHSIIRRSALKLKPVFINDYNPAFFNISSHDLLMTHYPLDPKWLFVETVISYKTFETGSTDSSLIIINWKEEIDKCLGKSNESLNLNDAERASVFNCNNYFDYGIMLYQSASNFDIQKNVTGENRDQFIDTKNRLNKAYDELLKQSFITDSTYKERFKDLKKLKANLFKAMFSIDKDVTSSLESFNTSSNIRKKKSNDLYKKMADLNKKIQILHETHLKASSVSKGDKLSSKAEREAKISILDNEMTQPSYSMRLDSINDLMIQFIRTDAILNDSISLLYKNLVGELRVLYKRLLKNDEISIRAQVDSVFNIYTMCHYLTDRKKENNSRIQNMSNLFKETRNNWSALLKQEQLQLSQLYRSGSLTDAAYDIYDYSLSQNIELYLKQIEFDSRLITHYDFQNGFITSTLESFKTIHKLVSSVNKQFNQWYMQSFEWEDNNYNKDKEIIINTLKEAVKLKKSIDLKLAEK